MQGFNMGRYYPPDESSPPSFNKTSHPLGKRANKIDQGILTVRFELPFAVWCNHCTPTAIVGQGVRFNAEKKKVGNYHSTPIWSFRMKHSACGGWWEIRTDPQKAEYVVVEGAIRREYGPDDRGALAEGDLKFLTEEEKEKRRNDAFANLEGTLEEKGNDRQNKRRVEELYESSGVWRDPYDVNARLRKGFREERKVLRKEEKHKERMQDKFGLGIDVVDETDADRTRARMIDFDHGEVVNSTSSWRPLFEDNHRTEKNESMKRSKTDATAKKSREKLQNILIGNTKAAIDPFHSGRTTSTQPIFGLLRRRREVDEVATSTAAAAKPPIGHIPGNNQFSSRYYDSDMKDTTPSKQHASPLTLVGYDSD